MGWRRKGGREKEKSERRGRKETWRGRKIEKKIREERDNLRRG